MNTATCPLRSNQQDAPVITQQALAQSDGSTKAQKGPPKTRARTGCFTCRARKVKCDEARPTCARCLKSQYVCDGYPDERDTRRRRMLMPTSAAVPGSRGQSQTNRQVAIRPTAKPSIPPRLYTIQGFDEQNTLYFESFRFRIGASIIGESPGSHCLRIILEQCFQDASIRQSVLAVGALNLAMSELPSMNEKIECGEIVRFDPESWPFVIKRHHQASLKYHVNALAGFRKRIQGNASTQPSARTILMMTLLLVLYEFQQANSEAAAAMVDSTGVLLGNIKASLSPGKELDTDLRNIESVLQAMVHFCRTYPVPPLTGIRRTRTSTQETQLPATSSEESSPVPPR